MGKTTMLRDSDVGDAWIVEMYRANPVQFIVDPKTGQPTTNILTGPVRLSFTDALFTAQKKMKSNPDSPLGFYCSILFPPITDMILFQQEYHRIAAAEFPAHWNGAGWGGLDPYARNQAEKPQYAGYTPNCMFMNVSSNFKPAIVDSRMNPIVDQSQIYAGCWAILAVNCYASGKNTPRKGPRFGLQTIMKVADDTNLGGAAADPRLMFGNVKVQPPAGQVAAAFAHAAPPLNAPQFGPGAVAQIQQAPAQQWAPPAPQGQPPGGYAQPAPAWQPQPAAAPAQQYPPGEEWRAFV